LVVGEDADDVGTPFHLCVKPFQGICAVNLAESRWPPSSCLPKRRFRRSLHTPLCGAPSESQAPVLWFPAPSSVLFRIDWLSNSISGNGSSSVTPSLRSKATLHAAQLTAGNLHPQVLPKNQSLLKTI
jgi:hypothetical protein